MPSRSTLTASSVYFLSATLFSFSHSVIAESSDLETQIREAAVAQLNQNKAQALEKALAEAEKEAVGDTPTAQQQHLQKILKLAIAKATNEHDYNLEQGTQKLIEQVIEDNNDAPVSAISARQAAMNDALESATASALSTVQITTSKDEKTSEPAPVADKQSTPAITSSATQAISEAVSTEKTAAVSEEKPTLTTVEPTAKVEAQSSPKEASEAPTPATTASVKATSPEPSPEPDQKPSKAESTQAQTAVDKSPENTIAQAPQQVATQAPSKQAIQLKTEQWMYIGQFKDGSWTEKTIAIGDTLPQAGQQYAVSQSVNVRAGLPNKENMPAVITSLGNNAKITLVELKASGNQGYYWGKIER
ncbi:MAG: hypothetical protein ACWA5U_09960 [bacterium]